MEKDSKFHELYSRVIEKYQEEGSSRFIPDEEVRTLKPIWYLPHHAVWHPRKLNEPRVVFDCACNTEGVSLNDQLLQGPANTCSLPGVILRFRVHSIAVAADVRGWWPDGDLKVDFIKC